MKQRFDCVCVDEVAVDAEPTHEADLQRIPILLIVALNRDFPDTANHVLREVPEVDVFGRRNRQAVCRAGQVVVHKDRIPQQAVRLAGGKIARYKDVGRVGGEVQRPQIRQNALVHHKPDFRVRWVGVGVIYRCDKPHQFGLRDCRSACGRDARTCYRRGKAVGLIRAGAGGQYAVDFAPQAVGLTFEGTIK